MINHEHKKYFMIHGILCIVDYLFWQIKQRQGRFLGCITLHRKIIAHVHCRLITNLTSIRTPEPFFWKAALQLISPQHVLVPGVFFAICLCWTSGDSSLASIPVCQGSICCNGHSSQFCIIYKLCEMHSVISSRSLMKSLNSIFPNVDLWEAPIVCLVTAWTLCCWSETSELSRAQPIFSPPHLPVHLVSTSLTSSIRMVWETVVKPSKIKINIHCSPLVHQASQVVREVYQVGQEWFCAHKG